MGMGLPPQGKLFELWTLSTLMASFLGIFWAAAIKENHMTFVICTSSLMALGFFCF